MELRNIKTFLRVAELLSFSRAAEELHYTQSAVTIQIKQLERELGVELFERFGKNICLTRPGETFIKYASDLMKAADAALSFLHDPGMPYGPLRIGTVESLCSSVLPNILQELHAACPMVETVVRTSSIDRLTDMLNRNELDILYFLDKKLFNADWVKAAEQAVDIVFVAASSHKFAGGGSKTLRDIVGEPFILTEQGVNYRHELEQRLAAKNQSIVPYLDIENTAIIARMLRTGTSISFLPLFAVQRGVEAGDLAIIEVADIKVKMWKQLIYHKKKMVTPQMQFFIDQIIRLHDRQED